MTSVIARRLARLVTARSLARAVGGARAALGAAALATALVGTPACAFQADDPAAARAAAAEALRTGRYDDALARLQRLAALPNAEPAVRATDRRRLLRTLLTVGHYEEAERLARQYVVEPDGALVATAAGEVLVARGKAAEAQPLFERAAAAAPDSLTARLHLAELRLARGDRAAAMRDFDAFIDVYRNAQGRLTSHQLAAVAAALRQLGRENPQLFKDALRVYDEAIAADSTNLDARIRLGELFLEKYNGPDAATTLGAVLRANPHHPAALVASARQAYQDGQGDPRPLLRRALETNPDYPPAHAFLARLALDVEDYAAARTEAERALAVDAAEPDALAVLAATHFLSGDAAGFEAVRRRAEAHGPAAADFYVTLADLSARSRFYADAATFAGRAVAIDSAAARALALLGVNLLRTGDAAAARQALEAGFARDPYDVWTKNTLDLLDAVRDYREVSTPHFRFLFAPTEADLLAPYAGALAEEAYAGFVRRYGWQPSRPVRLEVYPRHADFSVRTVGLAGLGALGVSFGNVLAMDSPAARDAGSFNWGSTLWHELAHTFTLGLSEHRVPRWLSEGISVYEERRARLGWGDDATPAFLAAYKAGRVPPPSRLNDGFMRPDYPAQLLFAYYQASLVAELIEREKGAEALPRMLRLYAQARSTPAVFREVLGMTPEQLDERYDAYVRQRFAAQLAAVSGAPPADSAHADESGAVGGSFAEALERGASALRAGRDDEALAQLERAKALFPDAPGPDSPRRLLAELHERRGDLRAAADELTALTAVDGDDYDATVKLAALREQLGDTAAAADALERAIWISPYDPAVHQRLAEYATRFADDPAVAVRERRAVLALRPADEAEARYQLALALQQAGDLTEARREVLRALEIAPAFEKAQQLLLALSGNGAGGRG